MRKKILLGLALMAIIGLGGIVFDRASAGQNSNSSTTMAPMNRSGMSRRRGRRHGRRHERRHRRRAARRGRGNMNR